MQISKSSMCIQNHPTQKREKRRTTKESSDSTKFDNIDLNEENPIDKNNGISSTSRRSQVNNECQCSESATTMIEKAKITYIKPLKAKIQSVNPSMDDQVPKPKVNQSDYNHNPYRLRSMGVPTCYQSSNSGHTSRIFQWNSRQPYQYQVIVNS